EAAAHRMSPAVPVVEVADDADAPRIGRPGGKADAGNAEQLRRLRPKSFVESLMASFAEQMHIEIAENRWKPIGIVDVALLRWQVQAQPVGHSRMGADDAGKEPRRMLALEFRHLRALFVDDADARRRRLEAADHQTDAGDEMRPQQAEGVVM